MKAEGQDPQREFWGHFERGISELRGPQDARFPNQFSPARLLALTKHLASAEKIVEEEIWEIARRALMLHAQHSCGEGAECFEKSVSKLQDLVSEKGLDYNAGGVSILDYFIYGTRSIIHEIHKRALRLVAIASSGAFRKESLSDVTLDLAAYCLFLIAFLRVDVESVAPKTRSE